ncbi:replication initiator [Nonomuraea sp. NPDC051941]|uniref:replication initiator n=1 Tax=Nonomuraea sp. NPDC051941 TaxID=3364373 RepID=UPI0037C8A940
MVRRGRRAAPGPARDALHFSKLVDRAAATYHQVWWPPADQVVFDGEHLPVWDEQAGYVDPATGEVLPTWDEALDQLNSDETAEPLHVIRFGSQMDVQGVLAGTPDADQCIRYLCKYLTKSLGESLDGDDQSCRDHAARLAEAPRFEPCSPACANWLRYGIQPKGAKSGMTPGRCRGKTHKPHLRGLCLVQDVRVVHQDPREVDAILSDPQLREVIKPDVLTAVIAGRVLHFLSDEEAVKLIGALRARPAPRSLMAFSVGTSEGLPAWKVDKAVEVYTDNVGPMRLRTKREIIWLLDGCAMRPPGLVKTYAWCPSGTDDITLAARDADTPQLYAGLVGFSSRWR